MIINDVIINADCETIVLELQRQLQVNKIPYLQKIINGAENIMVQCPYHKMGQERRPSAGIRKEDGTFHCLACNEVHTLPEVISYCFSKDDMFGKWGMKWLVKNFATVRKEERADVKIDMERNNTSHKDSILDSNISDKSDSFITEEELDSYRYYHKYWEERGIIDDDIIELFDLGYDKRTDCITFPVRDILGNCLFVARRNVKTKWFNYPKDVDKPLYGLYEYAKELHSEITWLTYTIYSPARQDMLDVYITESMIDCILLWQAGKLAFALNGTGSANQLEILRKAPFRKLILATDNDKAGKLAREKIRKSITNKLITEIDFPDDIKDIGDLGKAQRFKDIENIERWEVF